MLPHLGPSDAAWALSLLTAATLAVGAGDALAQGQKLRVGSLKIASLTNVDVAAKTGIFARNGLDVEVIQFRSGNEAIAAQRGGHVDVVLSIPGTAMNANERGFDLVLVAQNETAQARGPDSGALIVLNDSGLDDAVEAHRQEDRALRHCTPSRRWPSRSCCKQDRRRPSKVPVPRAAVREPS